MSYTSQKRANPVNPKVVLKNLMISVVIVSLILANFGCSYLDTRKKKGAVIGTAAGGTIGGVVGKKAGHTVIGAILGAAVGGAAGAYIGNYMDKQAAEIEGAKVERVAEGINVSFESGIFFDVNKAALTSQSKEDLNKFSEILQKYENTEILIEGHTDSTGSEEHNLELSRVRAQAVANLLAGFQVNPKRLIVMGYGESQPIALNNTPEGQQSNRRVEIAIMADDELKKNAQSETK